jgi:putative FmdB family regulatory protein
VMAGYLYRCEGCGPWEIQQPIGTAAPEARCPLCGASGRRLYTAPLLRRSSPAATARLREEASRDEPQVTTGVPARPARPVPRDPRWSKLPRP